MPIIEVAKTFRLANPDKSMIDYLPGRYEVTEEIANHWYVKAHLVGFVAPAPTPGSMPYAQAALVVAQAVRMGEAVADQTPKPAPPPANVMAAVPMSRAEVPDDANYFAGKPQEDKSLPDASGISYAQPPR